MSVVTFSLSTFCHRLVRQRSERCATGFPGDNTNGYIYRLKSFRSGDWDPDNRDSDRRSRDALAARGYWQTFQLVRETVRAAIAGDNPAVVVRAAHQDWYRELSQPSVAAGLIPASALAGYRNGPVYLRGSRHVPPRWEAVRDGMPTLFDLLEAEAEPSVKAVLGHWLFGYIHPYSDGNGRMARFVQSMFTIPISLCH